MRSHIPKLHQSVKESLINMLDRSPFCSLTSDMWTSRATIGYITLTCHFLVDWTLHSAVLETRAVPEAHTSENIAAILQSIVSQWKVESKIVGIVTDNAANMKAVQLCNWKHLGCFAHTLNIIVQRSISSCDDVNDVLKKSRSIVAFFHRSTKAATKLTDLKKLLSLSQHKLIQYVETRWNSRFYMF